MQVYASTLTQLYVSHWPSVLHSGIVCSIETCEFFSKKAAGGLQPGCMVGNVSPTCLFVDAGWGYRRGALSTSGTVAAAVVGLCTLGCSLRFGATLLSFFFSSSKLTQYKEELKGGLDDNGKKGGQRDWRQVRGVDSTAWCLGPAVVCCCLWGVI